MAGTDAREEDEFDRFERDLRAEGAGIGAATPTAAAPAGTGPTAAPVPPTIASGYHMFGARAPGERPEDEFDRFDRVAAVPTAPPPPPTGLWDQAKSQFWETPLGLGFRSQFLGDPQAQDRLAVLNAQPRRYPLAEATSDIAFPEGVLKNPQVTLGGALTGVAGAAALGGGAAGIGALGRGYAYALKNYPVPTALLTEEALRHMPSWLRHISHLIPHE